MTITTEKGVELNLLQASYTNRLMGDNSLVFNFISPSVLDIEVGDTLVLRGKAMIIRKEPVVQKLSSNRFSYSITFEGLRYQLNDMPFMDEGDITFSYFGDAEQYLELIVENMKTINPLWSVGNIAVTEEKHISFDNVSCMEAIDIICQEFSLEWNVRGYSIDLVLKVGADSGLELEYGRGRGLYSITRSPIEQEGIFTRVLAYGSTKNLPDSYSGSRLRLEDPLDNNVSIYGLKVTTYIDDTIYPHYEGTAGTVASDGLSFIDTGIDFNINDYLLEGNVAKVVFKSGELNGYQFEITRFDNTLKRVYFKPTKDGEDYTLPNSTFSLHEGDKYTFVDIRMPSSYIDNALEELEERAGEYLDKVSIPQVVYDCDIDLLHLKRLAVMLDAGDEVTIKDDDLGINKKIRIQSVTYPGAYPDLLLNGMSFQCEISDSPTYGTLTYIKKEIVTNKENISTVEKEAQEINRNAIVNLREFRSMVFDPDGNIAEPFLQAIALEVGAESQYFDLNGVFINTNVDGDANAIDITGGTLIHYTYGEDIGGVWAMSALFRDDLVSATPYYISARCSKTLPEGTWFISSTPMSVDSEAGYYHFNLGTLSSVIDGQRMTNITKGYTRIAGGQIDTDTLIAKRVALPQMEIGLGGHNEQSFYYDGAKTQKAVSFGVINGKPQLIWYDINGVEIWNASSNGIVYVTNIPESITQVGMRMLVSIDAQDEVIDPVILHGQIVLNATRVNEYQAYIGNETVYFEYDAGANNNTTANAIYEGYHTMNEKTSPFIPNGMYVFTGIDPNYDLISESPDTHEFTAHVYRIWQGKVFGNPIDIDFTLPI